MISAVAQRQKINPVARLPVDWIAKERKTRRCITKIDSDATQRRVKSGQVAKKKESDQLLVWENSRRVDPVAGYRELQPVDKESSRKLQCTQSQATVFCMSSRRKTRHRKNQLLVAILAFCGILRNQSTSARIQTLAREFQQFLHEYRSVVELERKSAATQIPQRRNFSGDANSAATQIQQRCRLHRLHETS
ncbi:cell wall surface anchor family protein (ISS) [Dorcoceras hygrometricum]|uniref:Cell wall surface anchor family protein (ISS) n=1 Tax=Dorcoceras hygrometricum TaxID=472368 RepID=A0A2Z7B5H9_9LAMI|nr:cell wall surface anchor family protein (ISS) [Dorcoceras hygrometricum]